jgi:uncharacterized membrane protein YfcA
MWGAGFLAGIINTLAGSGSVFTLSALLWTGMDPLVANGSNRLGVLGQSMVAGLTYIRSGKFNLKKHILHLVCAVIGAVVGAYLASITPATSFKWLIVAVMIGMLFLILFNPKPQERKHGQPKPGNLNTYILFTLFLIGGYGGFIQMGMGVITLIVLVDLLGFEFHRANGLKLLITFFFSVPVLIIYIYQGQFSWEPALAITLGQIPGAWLCAKLIINRSEVGRWVKYLLIAIICITVFKLIFLA